MYLRLVACMNAHMCIAAAGGVLCSSMLFTTHTGQLRELAWTACCAAALGGGQRLSLK